MNREFAKSGIHFQYPKNWLLEAEEIDDGWSASVSSPETAFILLCYHSEFEDPAELVDRALETMRESYPDLESERAIETLAGMPAIGYDIDFITLDLTNSCWVRALICPEGCLLLMSQCTDLEMARNGQVLKAIAGSLKIEDGSIA